MRFYVVSDAIGRVNIGIDMLSDIDDRQAIPFEQIVVVVKENMQYN